MVSLCPKSFAFWCLLMFWCVSAQTQAPAEDSSDSPSDVPSSAPSVSSFASPSLFSSATPTTVQEPALSLAPFASDSPSALPTLFAPVPTLSPQALPTAPESPTLPSNAPTPRETTEKPNVAPSIFQAPTIAYCRQEADSVRQCYKGLVDASACDSCAADAIPSTATDCQQLSDNLCNELANCPCFDCTPVVEGFLACAFSVTNGCNIDCS